MRAGGIWDQLGGGFHRYSTDERWLVPHFEKMLYDNALLLRLYVDGWRAFGDERVRGDRAGHRRVRRARDDVARRAASTRRRTPTARARRGSSSSGRRREVDAGVRGRRRGGARRRSASGASTPEGNFEDSGATVLSLRRALPRTTREEARARARPARARCSTAREKRPKPFRDEKILASWNGADDRRAGGRGRALDDPSLVAAAERALRFVERVLVVRDGQGRARVRRLAKDGVAKGQGFLDDHAYVADAALDLYEATGDPR